MGTRIVRANEYIYRIGDKITEISIIVKGNVEISSSYNHLVISSGHIIGLPECYGGEYAFDCRAKDEVTLYSYAYSSPEDLLKIIEAKPEMVAVIATTMFNALSINIANYESYMKKCYGIIDFLKEGYDSYIRFARDYDVIPKSLPELDNLECIELSNQLDPWIIDLYKILQATPMDKKRSLNQLNKRLCYATIMESSRHLVSIMALNIEMGEYIARAEDIIMNSDETDLYSLFSQVMIRAKKSGKDTAAIEDLMEKYVKYLQESVFSDKRMISDRIMNFKEHMENLDNGVSSAEDEINSLIREEIKGSLNVILEYSRLSVEAQNVFRKLVKEYKELPDKNSSDNQVRALRKQLTAQFFDIYEAVALRSFFDNGYSNIIKMFLYFGYVDEDIAGHENAEYLYKLAEKRRSDPQNHTFTLYEWLRLIFDGQKEPSKNEFDMDYTQYVKEERRVGRISEKEEKELLEDKTKKVQYELKNAARSANQVTFGRISTYCPIFSEHNVIKKLESMYVTNGGVEIAVENVRQIDYSAFYRETAYTDEANGIKNEYIAVEVLPDVILMPNVGIRGSMWQEYYGSYRNTPARFFLPIFCGEDLSTIMCRLIGEFRWELCKRIQGSRWNDITDKSLTSEFCDYAQFYKKNSDLSTEAKEKIKRNLVKCKNNFRELFIYEYMIWVKFESQGSARLNKVSRAIMFEYCTFSPMIRKNIISNPMYKDLVERYENRKQKKIHSVDIRFSKIVKEGGKITPELEAYREFMSQ